MSARTNRLAGYLESSGGLCQRRKIELTVERFFQVILCDAMALAAASGHGKLFLQTRHRAGALSHRTLDVFLGHIVANTNVH